VELAPRRDAVDAPPPDPIRSGGRALASPQAPFIPHPSASRETAPPMRVAPGAVAAPIARPVPRSVEQARPAPRIEPQAQPQPQPQPERRAVSREPRRVAPAGRDPLAARAGEKRDQKGEKDGKGDKK